MLKREHFGITFPREGDELAAKLWCFTFPKTAAASGGPKHAEKADWFWECAYHLWGPKNPNGVKFIGHPWAEQMVHEACANRYVGYSGCASGGKTDFLAVWGVITWLAAPHQTKVFMTSTSLMEARSRIWGKMLHYWRSASVRLDGYGKFLDSIGIIRPYKQEADGTVSAKGDTAGIQLIAGERSNEKEAVGKLIGFKCERVLMLADELAELTPSLLDACWGNLGPGNPDLDLKGSLDTLFGFQMLAASNFKSFTDPFGVFVEPRDGWNSINIDSTRWETKRGVCLRFDGLKSPNLLLTEDKWPIYGRKHLAEHEKLGRNTVQFWRMCRSFPAPEGVEAVIYSQQELLVGGACDRVVWSEGRKQYIAALDPAFTSGGDRSIMVVGVLGWDLQRKRVLSLEEVIEIKADVTSKEPYDKQVAIRFRDECFQRRIGASEAAYDATGAGISFGTLLGELWNSEVMGVKFGGKATALSVNNGDTIKPAYDVYANRVSELWYRGKDFVRAGQIKGITNDLAEEMTARHYDILKGVDTRIMVESKKEMKSRLSKSPDIGDAFMILLDLAISRFGFVPVGGGDMENQVEVGKISAQALRLDMVYDDEAILAYD